MQDSLRCEASTGTSNKADSSDAPQLTLAQVTQYMRQVGMEAAATVPPTQLLKPLRLNLNTSPAALPAQPEAAMHSPHAGPEDDINGDSSTCPCGSRAYASLNLDAASECSSRALA